MKGKIFLLFVTIFVYTKNCFANLSHDVFFSTNHSDVRSLSLGSIPDYWDWRERSVVSPVKDQGMCGACWAFSIVGSIESLMKIYYKKEFILSEQFLLDCDSTSPGCSAGELAKSFGFMVSMLGGILKKDDYFPYTEDKVSCRWNGYPKPIPVLGFKIVEPNEDVIAKYVYRNGPISVGINSNSMKKYKGNYIDDPTKKECPSNDLNHAVVIVGYSVYVSKDGQRVPYWIIKNSWGKLWGDNGFYYLVRGKNACGIANQAVMGFVN